MNFKLDTEVLGTIFEDVAKKAKQIAKQQQVTVEFNFNGITCLVSELTVPEWLFRDYMNAHIMEWKTVGPDCSMSYSADTEIELHTRKLDAAKKRKLQEEEMERSDQAAKAIIDKQIEGITILIHGDRVEEYKSYVANNSNDGYSRAVIDYGETWAKLMQLEISKGRTAIKDIAEECQKGLGYLGITGFQYGAVVNGLSHFWVFGEELRRWHNKEYGVNEDQSGVVNPAILTIGK